MKGRPPTEQEVFLLDMAMYALREMLDSLARDLPPQEFARRLVAWHDMTLAILYPKNPLTMPAEDVEL